jgi:rhomboid family GlyGly-CTERM serine protease
VIPSPGARRARLSTSIAAWLSARALSLSLAALAILVYGLDSIFGAVDMSAALQLDAARPLEVWRLITGHWTHWSIDHLFWAVLMFAVLGAELEVRSRRRFALFVICSALVISGHALWSQSALFVYRGLSGIDSALFVAFAIAQLRQPGRMRWLFAAALFGFLAKLGFESWSGSSLFADCEGFHVYVPAHLLGGLVAVPFGNLGPKRRRLRPAPCR